MYKSTFFAVIVILVLGVTLIPLSAQDDFDPCGKQNLGFAIEALNKAIKEAEEARTTNEAVDILAAISSKIISLQGYCNEWAFGLDGGGAVIDEIELEEGTYIAFVQNEGPFEATITAEEGECYQGMGNLSSETLFSLEEQNLNAQAVIYSAGCTATIVVDSEYVWRLIITQLNP